MLAVGLCTSTLAVIASDDDPKCPCQKPPKFDCLSLNVTRSDSDKCPCTTVKPKSELIQQISTATVPDEKCPCSTVKPKTDTDQLETAKDQTSLEKCPCSIKPTREIIARICACMAGKPKPYKLDEFTAKCPCSVKPRPHSKPSKEQLSEGAEVFVGGAHAIMECVEGGLVVQNTGSLKEGLPYIFEGINSLVELASRSENPEVVYNQIYDFMAQLNQQEMTQLLNTARTIKKK
jgi:hypothetical protein